MGQPENLMIKIRELKNVILFKAQGKIDMFSSPFFRNRLIRHYDGNKAIIIDLSNVDFMDSSGVATLVEGLAWSRKKNKEFILFGLGLNVHSALSLTKLETIFNIRSCIENPLSMTQSHSSRSHSSA